MHDFKHLATRNIQGQIARHTKPALKPDQSSWQEGWNYPLSERLTDMALAAAATALMILGMFYALSEAVIRGWIG